MQKFYSFIFFYCLLCNIHAQQKIFITGKITDAKKNPLLNITVNLVSNKDSSVLKRTQTDIKGLYQFNSVVAGNYIINASASGMRDAYSSPFQITNSTTIFSANTIQMISSVNILHDVKVTASNKPVEMKQGKLIYNVEKSITASGNSAFEIFTQNARR